MKKTRKIKNIFSWYAKNVPIGNEPTKILLFSLILKFFITLDNSSQLANKLPNAKIAKPWCEAKLSNWWKPSSTEISDKYAKAVSHR